MKISEQLQAARNLIDTPDKWHQGEFVCQGKICASEALARVVNTASQHHAGSSIYMNSGAYNTLSESMGVNELQVSNFNDSHTHEEVLAAFDRAIDLAKSRELPASS